MLLHSALSITTAMDVVQLRDVRGMMICLMIMKMMIPRGNIYVQACRQNMPSVRLFFSFQWPRAISLIFLDNLIMLSIFEGGNKSFCRGHWGMLSYLRESEIVWECQWFFFYCTVLAPGYWKPVEFYLFSLRESPWAPSSHANSEKKDNIRPHPVRLDREMCGLCLLLFHVFFIW